jgi:hypothetical protein
MFFVLNRDWNHEIPGKRRFKRDTPEAALLPLALGSW